MRRYLLGKVTHIIGGFGKGPGEVPGELAPDLAKLVFEGSRLTERPILDLLHSYLGLATLAIYNEPGLKAFDPTFCMSAEAVERMKTLI
jgi:geranylgeranyl transferase type-1 subunit beta